MGIEYEGNAVFFTNRELDHKKVVRKALEMEIGKAAAIAIEKQVKGKDETAAMAEARRQAGIDTYEIVLERGSERELYGRFAKSGPAALTYDEFRDIKEPLVKFGRSVSSDMDDAIAADHIHRVGHGFPDFDVRMKGSELKDTLDTITDTLREINALPSRDEPA